MGIKFVEGGNRGALVRVSTATVVPPDSTAQGSDGQRRQHLRPRRDIRLSEFTFDERISKCTTRRSVSASSSFQQEMSKDKFSDQILALIRLLRDQVADD
jgi:hypothetical protein